MKKPALIWMIILLLPGCSIFSGTLVDKVTKPEAAIIASANPQHEKVLYKRDNMDSGEHRYFDKNLNIEPSESIGEIKRGEILFYKDEQGDSVIKGRCTPGRKNKNSKGAYLYKWKKARCFLWGSPETRIWQGRLF